MQNGFNILLEKSIKEHWSMPALTDFKGATHLYKDVARKIEKIHLIFEAAGINQNDKIALCGRNNANWAISFFAIVSYGAVAVPILHDFKPDNIHHIVNHSDAKILFAGSNVWENLNESLMENINAVLSLEDFELLSSRSEKINYTREHLNELFGKKFPNRFNPEDVKVF
jgi:Long-chain acyl-CoA synthetases (AMP-forming)